MNNSIKIFKIFSTFFIILLGTLLHFTFEWSNNNLIVGAISAVNESTWEHLKLLFFPTLLTTIIGYFYFKNDIPNFLCGKTTEVLISMFFTTITYYTYLGIVGRDIAVINILIFIIAAIIGEYVNFAIINSNFKCNKKVAILILIALTIMFIYFTYNPPKIGLFKDPVSGEYGII